MCNWRIGKECQLAGDEDGIEFEDQIGGVDMSSKATGKFNRHLYHDMVFHTGGDRRGAKTTNSGRKAGLRLFCIWLMENNTQVRKARDISNKHLKGYIEHLLRRGLALGTLQNQAAYIRAACPQLSFTNAELGISGRDRSGKKCACPLELYLKAVDALSRLQDPGPRLVLQLQWYLGLRREEALMAGPSLKRWRESLGWVENNLVEVSRGTKGGRLRNTMVVDLPETLALLDEAIAWLRKSRRKDLIKSRSIQAAKSLYGRTIRAVGLRGMYSSHSLRYAYAQRLLRHFARQGCPERHAYAVNALSLGHGDGRARYVKQVYGRDLPPYSELSRKPSGQDIRIAQTSFKMRLIRPSHSALTPTLWKVVEPGSQSC